MMSKNSLTKIKEENDIQDLDNIEIPLLDQEQDLDALAKDQFVPAIKINDEDDDSSSFAALRKKKEKKNIVVVTGQSGFDLDEIFGFGKDQVESGRRLTLAKRMTRIFGQHTIEEDEEVDLYDKLPKYFAYYILTQSVIIGSIMTPWIQTIKADKQLRIAWRFGFQSLMLIPFVLYEKRTISEKFKHCYNLEYIFKKDNIRLLFLSSLNTSIVNATSTFCFEFTYISHVLLFVGMSNFWLSVSRAWKQDQSHFVETGGRAMCVIGIIIISLDCYFLDVSELPSKIHNFVNDKVFMKPPWTRVFIGNLLPIICSAVMVQLSKVTMDIKNYYPPFLAMFIISIFVIVNMLFFSYFIDGTSVSLNSFWGWFGLMSDGMFSEFMYMSIVLNFGLFMTQMFISKIFEPIIPAGSALIEPALTVFFLQFAGVQYMPGSLSGMGFLLILPGQFIIILGQHLLQKEKEYKEHINKKSSLSVKHQEIPSIAMIQASESQPVERDYKSQPIEQQNLLQVPGSKPKKSKMRVSFKES